MSPSASPPGTILIADDNRMNRLLLARGLEQQGHTIAYAEDGREALELLGQQRFDLMLLDVLMPELDGYEVLAELKDDPHLRDIPVIMTSALDELDSVVRGRTRNRGTGTCSSWKWIVGCWPGSRRTWRTTGMGNGHPTARTCSSHPTAPVHRR